MHKKFLRTATILLGAVLVSLGNPNDSLGMKEEEGPYSSMCFGKVIKFKTMEAKLHWDMKQASDNWMNAYKFAMTLNNSHDGNSIHSKNAWIREQKLKVESDIASQKYLDHSFKKNDNPNHSPRMNSQDILDLDKKYLELHK